MTILSRAGKRRFHPIAAERYGSTELQAVIDLTVDRTGADTAVVTLLAYNKRSEVIAMPLGVLQEGEELRVLFEQLGITERMSTMLHGNPPPVDPVLRFTDEGLPSLQDE